MKTMSSFIYKIKNDKRGVSSIEMVIAALIFLMLFSFMMDLLILSWKFNVVAQTNTMVARVAGIQGGIRSTAPRGYPGGNANYISSSEMTNIVRDKFNSAGIAARDYTFRVGSGRIGGTSTSSSAAYDYMSEFDTVVTVEYGWDFMSNFIPGELRNSMTSRRSTMSEWKYDYGTWEGE